MTAEAKRRHLATSGLGGCLVALIEPFDHPHGGGWIADLVTADDVKENVAAGFAIGC